MTFVNSLVMLTIPSLLHWLQYIGLNYVMVKRKYSDEQAKYLPFGNLNGVQSLTIVCAVILFFQYGIFLFCLNRWPQENLMHMWSACFLGTGLVHYLLDGFIWKFREPFIRQAMLPYLVRNEDN